MDAYSDKEFRFTSTSASGLLTEVSKSIRLFAVVLVGIIGIVGASVISGCSNEGTYSPKQVVIKLFGAMERNDKAAIANSLDLVALLETRDRDYALNLEEPREMRTPTDILDDLTDDGQTKTVWFSLQRIVGTEEIIGDTAYVEVSFLNKETGLQYYNKFGVHQIGERWRIFSFKTAIESSEEDQ